MDTEKVARLCHEVNRVYCESIGDSSQNTWLWADQWQKDSAVKGVEFILNNPSAPASAVHDSWLEEKRRDGWKYGPVKDPAKKEHPCFVSYDDLPVEQRLKDYLFKAVVWAFVQAEGH
jgi:hypothetical protein